MPTSRVMGRSFPRGVHPSESKGLAENAAIETAFFFSGLELVG